jgi:hypothetical protein
MQIRDNPRVIEELRRMASGMQDQAYARSLQENEDISQGNIIDRIKLTMCNKYFLWLCFIVLTSIGLPLILSCILKG